MLKKPALLALILLAATSVRAEGLKLVVEKNRVGFMQVYLENTGTEPITVVTDALNYVTEGSTVEMSPTRHVWNREQGDRVLLKGSVAHYAPVELRPGEITIIQNPKIRVVTKLVKYTIPEDWAALHGTWSGTAESEIALAPGSRTGY